MAEKLSEVQLSNLKNNLLMAKRLNEDQLLPQMLEAIERYTGVYLPSIGQNWDVVLNEIYPIIQYNLPSTFPFSPSRFSLGVGRWNTSNISTNLLPV